MKKRNVILYVVTLVLSIALFFWFSQMERERRDYIKLNGIETVGTITRKSTGRGSHGGMNYGVHFRFEHNGETFSRASPYISREQFNSIEVGDRFKVMFLPCRPLRDAIILLDRPVTD